MELESLPVRRAGSYVTLQTALFWEKQTVPRLVLNFLRHILNSFLAAQHSPLKAASRTKLKTGKVNGGDRKREGEREFRHSGWNMLFWFSSCSSQPGSRGSTLWCGKNRGVAPLCTFQKIAPVFLASSLVPPRTNNENCKHVHGYNKPHSALEKDIFPIQFGEDSVPPQFNLGNILSIYHKPMK